MERSLKPGWDLTEEQQAQSDDRSITDQRSESGGKRSLPAFE